jgi:SAM-dependent methyltransferase
MAMIASDRPLVPSLPVYFSVGLVAGAVIALQLCIMRIFAVGSWAHFGSFVVSLAMLGFGLVSAVMCIGKGWFDRHARSVATASLLLFGPLTAGANLLAQQLPFNAVFLVADPSQKWRLAVNFVLYLLPFVTGAGFLGTVFLKAQNVFGRVYFADLTGAGLGGMALLSAMYQLAPDELIVMPLSLWVVAGAAWVVESRRNLVYFTVATAFSFGLHCALPPVFGLPKLALSDYKGAAYAQKMPDNRRTYQRASPFGYLEIYASSYLHFAPGLSDNAAFNLPALPANAYLGLYLDGDGPIGIIRDLPPQQTDYFRFLPMIYPYLIKPDANTFVVQFGGGISTALSLRSGSHKVTVSESNPAILDAFRTDPGLRQFTGDILNNPRVAVVDADGRLYLTATSNRYDIVDLSLADSAGLSSPGGFAIVEKFAYTREAMLTYMRALKPGGILAVTLWNKEEPPKSVLKLYTTMAAAARALDPNDIADRFFVVDSYLSTATVLYKRDGFTGGEVAKLREHTDAMSFDEIYYPGLDYDTAQTAPILGAYRDQIFSNMTAPLGSTDGKDGAAPGGADQSSEMLPSTTMGRLAWHYLIRGGWDRIAADYVFDTRPLTSDRPYFAGYVKPTDLLRVTDRLDLLQDEWGYLLLWATLAIACLGAVSLVMLPVVFGWRMIFSAYPGKFSTIVYFACLGLAYIMAELGFLAVFVSAVGNATVSAAVVLTGMLVFSGFGSLLSERCLAGARSIMPLIFAALGALLIGYGLMLSGLEWTGGLPWRLTCCFALIFPPAFLMGFPMPTAMTLLARLGKGHMFLWAWGINGCFSVIAASAMPIVATLYGLTAVMAVSGFAYLLAMPTFFAVIRPIAARRRLSAA